MLAFTFILMSYPKNQPPTQNLRKIEKMTEKKFLDAAGLSK